MLVKLPGMWPVPCMPSSSGADGCKSNSSTQAARHGCVQLAFTSRQRTAAVVPLALTLSTLLLVSVVVDFILIAEGWPSPTHDGSSAGNSVQVENL
jgi:hypothetical protein